MTDEARASVLDAMLAASDLEAVIAVNYLAKFGQRCDCIQEVFDAYPQVLTRYVAFCNTDGIQPGSYCYTVAQHLGWKLEEMPTYGTKQYRVALRNGRPYGSGRHVKTR